MHTCWGLGGGANGGSCNGAMPASRQCSGGQLAAGIGAAPPEPQGSMQPGSTHADVMGSTDGAPRQSRPHGHARTEAGRACSRRRGQQQVSSVPAEGCCVCRAACGRRRVRESRVATRGCAKRRPPLTTQSPGPSRCRRPTARDAQSPGRSRPRRWGPVRKALIACKYWPEPCTAQFGVQTMPAPRHQA